LLATLLEKIGGNPNCYQLMRNDGKFVKGQVVYIEHEWLDPS